MRRLSSRIKIGTSPQGLWTLHWSADCATWPVRKCLVQTIFDNADWWILENSIFASCFCFARICWISGSEPWSSLNSCNQLTINLNPWFVGPNLKISKIIAGRPPSNHGIFADTSFLLSISFWSSEGVDSGLIRFDQIIGDLRYRWPLPSDFLLHFCNHDTGMVQPHLIGSAFPIR